MFHSTRRHVLKQSLAAAAAVGCGIWPAAAHAEEADARLAPDLVLVNGTVYTVDDARPRAEAFAVRQGKFIAVGSNDQVHKLIGEKTQLIDAAGKTVVPGFIDAHTHPADSGVYELLLVNCDLRTIAEIKDAMRKRAGETK